jgi:tetratricopeptide (TPR) repeat protein
MPHEKSELPGALRFLVAGASLGVGAAAGAVLTALAGPAGALAGATAAHGAHGCLERFFEKLTEYGGHFAGHKAADALAERLSETLVERFLDPTSLGQNHDLAALLGDAIALSLAKLARDTKAIPEGAQRDILRELSSFAPVAWRSVVLHPSIYGTTPDAIGDAIRNHVRLAARGEGEQAKPVPVEEWTPILRRIFNSWVRRQRWEGKKASTPTEATLKAAAERLYVESARAFFELLKEDTARGGKRFAAVHFAALGNLETSLQELALRLDSLSADSQALLRSARPIAVDALQGFIQGMEDNALRRHRGLIKRLSRIEKSLEPSLHLDPHLPSQQAGANLAARLTARQRSIPMVGREAEEKDLLDWLATERPIALRIITGYAGNGKTRLAQEVCDQARRAGWAAGFASRESIDVFLGGNALRWEWDEPTLAVFDYAGGRVEQIRAWLSGIAERREGLRGQPPLRMLLLDRHKGDTSTPIGRLLAPAGGSLGTAIEEWYDAAEDLVLLPAARKETALDILRAAAKAYPEGGIGSEDELLSLLSSLPDLRLDRTPLLLQLSILFRTAILGGQISGLENLLERWWRRELDVVLTPLATDHEIPHTLLEILVIVACLRQGLPDHVAEVENLARDSAKHFRVGAEPNGDAVRRALAAYLGSRAGTIAPLEPDLLAEYAVLRFLRAPGPWWSSSTEAAAWVKQNVKECPEALTLLIRAASDFPSLRPTWKFLEDEILWDVLPTEVLISAEAALPGHTTELRELAVAVVRALAHRAAKENWAPIDRATHLLAFSFRLSLVGQHEPALTPAREAIGILRLQAEAHPRTFEPTVAHLLIISCVVLKNANRLDEALVAAKEAVEIERRLALARLDPVRPTLAIALSDLGTTLLAVDTPEESMLVLKEAVEIFRALVKARPGDFDRDLAYTLARLGAAHGALDQDEKALEALRETVETYRRLARARPDAFESELASSLTTLASLLDPHSGLQVSEEAIRIYSGLAKGRPEVFEAELAVSLSTLGMVLLKLDRREEALDATERAVELFRRLSNARQSSAVERGLIGSLATLSDTLLALGRREDSLKATEEVVDRLRRLANARPGAFFQAFLASGLATQAGLLWELGRQDDALKATQQAVKFYRPLAKARPENFDPELALSLSNLGQMLSNLGQHMDALKTTEEAIDMFRRLVRARPEASFESDLARSLATQGYTLGELGRGDDALNATQKAVELYRPLAKARPEDFDPELAQNLNNMGQMLSDVGRHEDALKTTEEAVEVYRRLAKARPDFELHLAKSLDTQGSVALAAEQYVLALASFEEGLRILLPRAHNRPSAYRSCISTLLNGYVGACHLLKTSADAVLVAAAMEVAPPGAGGPL